MFEFGFDYRGNEDTFDNIEVMWQYRKRKGDYFNDLVLDSYACQNVSETRLHEAITEYQRSNDWN